MNLPEARHGVNNLKRSSRIEQQANTKPLPARSKCSAAIPARFFESAGLGSIYVTQAGFRRPRG
jgi:hypothetical protein